jgi:ribonuclease D
MTGALRFFYIDQPDQFATLITRLQSQARLYIDTETAYWWTPTPRLSLLQIQLQDGHIYVIDVIRPEMQQIVNTTFIPLVMQNQDIEKWAHNASFEKRFLGGSAVQSLYCTLQLARRVPYYLLPLEKLSLGQLVQHFFATELDKSYQKSDWSVRPLSQEQLNYAALDTEWCKRIHPRLLELIREYDPAIDAVEEIDQDYRSVVQEVAVNKDRIEAIRVAVKSHMLTNELDTYSAFSLHKRLSQLIEVGALIGLAERKDPARVLDFSFSVSRKLLAQLSPGAKENLVETGRMAISYASFFRGPVAGRKRIKPSYNCLDERQVGDDYYAEDKARRLLESHKVELRSRMRKWLDFRSLNSYREWIISDPAERMRADVRDLGPFVSGTSNCSVNLPIRFQIAFAPEEVEAVQNFMQSKESVVLVWRPGIYLDLSFGESRDWEISESEFEN